MKSCFFFCTRNTHSCNNYPPFNNTFLPIIFWTVSLPYLLFFPTIIVLTGSNVGWPVPPTKLPLISFFFSFFLSIFSLDHLPPPTLLYHSQRVPTLSSFLFPKNYRGQHIRRLHIIIIYKYLKLEIYYYKFTLIYKKIGHKKRVKASCLK